MTSYKLAAADRVADVAERADQLMHIRTRLKGLPRNHRRVLVSRFVDGLSTREIARLEDVPVGTVLSRIFNAKRLLRRALEAAP